MYDLGLNAVGILDTFKLSSLADATSIEVTVDPDGEGPSPAIEVLPDPINGWSYEWLYGTLKFNGTSVPLKGSTIVISYDIAPGTLPAAPIP